MAPPPALEDDGRRIRRPAMPARSRLRRRVALAAGSLVMAAALAAGVVALQRPADESGSIRAVVESQLSAFERNDAGGAFALAAPGVRQRFHEDADQFLAMVRTQYPMVHRPASVQFLPVEMADDVAFQKVRVTDQLGASWLVTYLLNRQQDRQWRISACLVVPDAARVSA